MDSNLSYNFWYRCFELYYVSDTILEITFFSGLVINVTSSQCFKSDQQGNIFSTFSRQQVGPQSLCHLKGSYMGKLLTKKFFPLLSLKDFIKLRSLIFCHLLNKPLSQIISFLSPDSTYRDGKLANDRLLYDQIYC